MRFLFILISYLVLQITYVHSDHLADDGNFRSYHGPPYPYHDRIRADGHEYERIMKLFHKPSYYPPVSQHEGDNLNGHHDYNDYGDSWNGHEEHNNDYEDTWNDHEDHNNNNGNSWNRPEDHNNDYGDSWNGHEDRNNNNGNSWNRPEDHNNNFGDSWNGHEDHNNNYDDGNEYEDYNNNYGDSWNEHDEYNDDYGGAWKEHHEPNKGYGSRYPYGRNATHVHHISNETDHHTYDYLKNGTSHWKYSEARRHDYLKNGTSHWKYSEARRHGTRPGIARSKNTTHIDHILHEIDEDDHSGDKVKLILSGPSSKIGSIVEKLVGYQLNVTSHLNYDRRKARPLRNSYERKLRRKGYEYYRGLNARNITSHRIHGHPKNETWRPKNLQRRKKVRDREDWLDEMRDVVSKIQEAEAQKLQNLKRRFRQRPPIPKRSYVRSREDLRDEMRDVASKIQEAEDHLDEELFSDSREISSQPERPDDDIEGQLYTDSHEIPPQSDDSDDDIEGQLYTDSHEIPSQSDDFDDHQHRDHHRNSSELSDQPRSLIHEIEELFDLDDREVVGMLLNPVKLLEHLFGDFARGTPPKPERPTDHGEHYFYRNSRGKPEYEDINAFDDYDGMPDHEDVDNYRYPSEISPRRERRHG